MELTRINVALTAEAIKSLRQKRGLTQKDVATACCVTTVAISQWENGKKLPSIEHFYDLAELFECDISDLINRSE